MSSLVYGITIGSLVAGTLADQFGRKKTMIFSCLFAFVFQLLMAFFLDLTLIIVFRALSGFGVGIICVIAPMYSAELASDKRRGILVSLFQNFIAGGFLLSYIFNLAFDLDKSGWRFQFGITSLIPFALGIATFFANESPVYIAATRTKSSSSSSEPKESLGQFMNRHLDYWKTHPIASTVAIVLAALYQLTGLNVVMYYCPSILQNVGITERKTALAVTIAIGVWNAGSTIIPLFIIDRFGRKPLLVVGAAIQSVGMALLALSYTLTGMGTNSAYIAIPSIAIFLTGFEVGCGPVYWVLISELFPPSVRGLSSSISQAVMWVSNIVIVIIFPPLVSAMSMMGFYWLLCGVSVILFLFCFFVIPETKNASAQEPVPAGTAETTEETKATETPESHEKSKGIEMEVDQSPSNADDIKAI